MSVQDATFEHDPISAPSFQYIQCVGSRLPPVKKIVVNATFQYIQCVGSRNSQPRTSKVSFGFNTSNVSVQGLRAFGSGSGCRSFNTSNVSVQDYDYDFELTRGDGFNTSNVSVQVPIED